MFLNGSLCKLMCLRESANFHSQTKNGNRKLFSTFPYERSQWFIGVFTPNISAAHCICFTVPSYFLLLFAFGVKNSNFQNFLIIWWWFFLGTCKQFLYFASYVLIMDCVPRYIFPLQMICHPSQSHRQFEIQI